MQHRNQQNHMYQVEAGAAVYSPWTLRFYDLVVLGLSNRVWWRCPTPVLVDWYQQHIRRHHLDIGVGTGYFLEHVPAATALTLFDLNAYSLHATLNRLANRQPQAIRGDITQPLPFATASFDSVGLNYVFHCLPGSFTENGHIFHELRRVVRPGGWVFGSTILADQRVGEPLASRVMAFYNSRGIFHNQNDTLPALEHALTAVFSHVQVQVVGNVVLFAGSDAVN